MKASLGRIFQLVIRRLFSPAQGKTSPCSPSKVCASAPKCVRIRPNLFMAPQFCDVCGNILDISNAATVKCDACGEVNQSPSFCSPLVTIADVFHPDTMLSQTTTSSSSNFPSELRNKLTSNTQVLTLKDRENTKKISQECPACHTMEVTWSEAQLRGADEGSTIFYRCPACSHRYG